MADALKFEGIALFVRRPWLGHGTLFDPVHVLLSAPDGGRLMLPSVRFASAPDDRDPLSLATRYVEHVGLTLWGPDPVKLVGSIVGSASRPGDMASVAVVRADVGGPGHAEGGPTIEPDGARIAVPPPDHPARAAWVVWDRVVMSRDLADVEKQAVALCRSGLIGWTITRPGARSRAGLAVELNGFKH